MAEIPGKVSSSHAPRVSVVIPTYNRARELRRCLDSLVAQSYRDFEVLICDDGSTDETATVATAFETRLELTYYWAENFGGPARPRNIGLNRARGIYVAFLDSDDWWAPRKLEMSVPRLDAGSDVVYHDLREARSTRQRLYWRRSRVRRLNAPVFQDLLLNGNALNTSSIVLRRDLLLRAGGFSEHPELIAWEDYDAWLQVAKLTDRFERLDEARTYWAGGGHSRHRNAPDRQSAKLQGALHRGRSRIAAGGPPAVVRLYARPFLLPAGAPRERGRTHAACVGRRLARRTTR